MHEVVWFFLLLTILVSHTVEMEYACRLSIVSVGR
jgi:hypothetical protein